jgi:hypothetical protein
MKAKDRENSQEYGIRWELEIKKARAKVCARCLSHLEEEDWREFLVGSCVPMWISGIRLTMPARMTGIGLLSSIGMPS